MIFYIAMKTIYQLTRRNVNTIGYIREYILRTKNLVHAHSQEQSDAFIDLIQKRSVRGLRVEELSL